MIAPQPEKSPEASSPSPDARREILNLPEAAAFLGVSTKTFQKVLREGDVPGRKVGREWKFSRAALADWVGAGRSRDFLDASDGPATASPTSAPSRSVRKPRRRTRADLVAEED